MVGMLTPEMASKVDILSVSAVAELVEARPGSFAEIFLNPDSQQAQFDAANLAAQGAGGGFQTSYTEQRKAREDEQKKRQEEGSSLLNQIAALESQIADLQARNEALEQIRNELSLELSAAMAAIAGKKVEANILDGQIANAQAESDALQQEYEVTYDDATDLTTAMIDQQESIVTVFGDDDLMHEVYQDENGEYYIVDFDGNRTNVADLNDPSQIADIEEQIAEGKQLGNENPEAAAEYASVLEAWAASQEELFDVVDEADEADNKLEELQNRRDELQNEIDALDTQISELNSQISKIDAEIAANNEQIAELQAQINDLQTQVNANTAQIDLIDSGSAYLTSAEFKKKLEAYDNGEISKEDLYAGLDPTLIQLLDEKEELETAVDTQANLGHFDQAAATYTELQEKEEEIAEALGEDETTADSEQTGELVYNGPTVEEIARYDKLSNDARNYADQLRYSPTASLSDLEGYFGELTDKERDLVVARLEDAGIDIVDDLTPKPEVENTLEVDNTPAPETEEYRYAQSTGPGMTMGGMGMG